MEVYGLWGGGDGDKYPCILDIGIRQKLMSSFTVLPRV
jgi:hypothetical protein